MWYFLVRLILLIVAIVIIVLCLHYIPQLQKKSYKKKCVCFFTSIVILSILLQYPYENLLFHRGNSHFIHYIKLPYK